MEGQHRQAHRPRIPRAVAARLRACAPAGKPMRKSPARPCLPQSSADQPSQHRPRRPVQCSSSASVLASAKRPLPFTGLRSVVVAGWPTTPIPPQAHLTLPTRPEVILDCAAPAACRGRAQRAPQKISTTRLLGTAACTLRAHLSTLCRPHLSNLAAVSSQRQTHCELAPARPRSSSSARSQQVPCSSAESVCQASQWPAAFTAHSPQRASPPGRTAARAVRLSPVSVSPLSLRPACFRARCRESCAAASLDERTLPLLPATLPQHRYRSVSPPPAPRVRSLS
ncbi:hypothetical protein K491DRAFT_105494 [Lophiostoma macrostomum CBS 122681]|uniref:Uncharacterized protein n=1 Tax=Lophiostoma macrostomum CBS 122681 TaxID=1314788 RepID=A0A6A6SXX6_9PLEO|nr:hypothetical protein K491DRAFT_105494 [Lophiostoma macrostomum CBS 122681]